jgi:hypothetical protein
MSLYEITIELDTTGRPDSLEDYCNRMLTAWFGPQAWTINIHPIDTRTCDQQATDDHNESVARSHGARTYTRTDGITIELEED